MNDDLAFLDPVELEKRGDESKGRAFLEEAATESDAEIVVEIKVVFRVERYLKQFIDVLVVIIDFLVIQIL